MTNTILWTIAIIIILALIIVVLAWFYERGTREVSLVRTGVGGRKVVMDGGTLAIPYFHEISRVNMQTLRLEVNRTGEAALITKDRLRVDVGVEFYVSVRSEEEDIARAVQTLGRRTFHADQLLELIEGKLVDSLRSVSARMSMDDLHENRGAFVAEVRDSLSDSLAINGLNLESVSLSALDQTPFDNLDENNAFNAVGMRKLAEVIAKSKKERAEIESDSEVSVRRAAMEASKRKLQIDLEEREAEISQVREIETLKAAQLAEVARQKATAEREAAQARIQMEQQIRASDIAREQATRQAEIAKDKELETAEITRERDIEIANMDRQISLAAKSQEESRAQAEADDVRASAVKSAEAVQSARQIADAERRQEIAGMTARSEAETAADKIRIAAKADKDAATDRAQTAEFEADAKRKVMMAEAEARQALNEAENVQSEQIVDMKMELARLEALPKVVAEMVKPAEKIDSIKVHNISGLGNGAGNGGDGSKPVVNQAIDSIMEMAVQLPALKKIGEELGISIEDGLVKGSGSSGKNSKKNTE
ncbi:MAG: flotillin [Alphaproteobacteria bacterium]|jgi:flotillin|nr:flotillin [Alphaproteobacteria bacterium]MBT4086600.1 flotillin [Alphaproteobacteria bacterium]MBT4542341.1 flotillin [Alphaproteobacteria bacterium]